MRSSPPGYSSFYHLIEHNHDIIILTGASHTQGEETTYWGGSLGVIWEFCLPQHVNIYGKIVSSQPLLSAVPKGLLRHEENKDTWHPIVIEEELSWTNYRLHRTLTEKQPQNETERILIFNRMPRALLWVAKGPLKTGIAPLLYLEILPLPTTARPKIETKC